MSWSAFSRFSPSRAVAQAVRRVLRDDPELADWTGRRIYYGTAVPDVPLPCIVVMMDRESATAVPSVGDLDVSIRVLVVFSFEETRDIVPDEEHDFSSVLLRADSALWANTPLLVDGVTHALRLDQAQDFGYEQINSVSVEGELAGTVYPARLYTYSYTRDAATGVRT